MKKDDGMFQNFNETILDEETNVLDTECDEKKLDVKPLSQDEVLRVRNLLDSLDRIDNSINDDSTEYEEVEEDNDDDDNDTSQKFSFKRLNKYVLAGLIGAITLILWICFKGIFLGMVFLLEVIIAGIYLLVVTYKEEEIISLDELSDGLKLITPDEISISLDDIVVKKPVEELKDLYDYIKNPLEFEKLGYKPETKVLFIGVPGLGKNTIIKALAHDTGLPIIRVNASRFFDAEDLIEKLFQIAKQSPNFKYIIQIDNFENIIVHDNSMDKDPETIIDKLNSHLTLYKNVILIATCEDIGIFLESADSFTVLFKKNIVFQYPEDEERIELLNQFTSHLSLDSDVNLNEISKNCFGTSIGDIKYMIDLAASVSRKHEHSKISMSDFFEAFDTLEFGNSKDKFSDESKKIVAYHEAGHALVHYLTTGTENLLRVISVGHGSFGGVTTFSPDTKKVVSTKEELLNEICVDYGGRCAEKIVFGHLSTGASGDITDATSTIYNMICSYGMSEKIGPINVAHKVVLGTTLNESEYILRLIADERHKIATECEERTMKLLLENRDKLDKLANYLIKHKTIDSIDMFLKIIERKE